MASTQSTRSTTPQSTATPYPPGTVPFRRAASAYTVPPADPLSLLSDDLTARYDVTNSGKPTGAVIGRQKGRQPARRAGFRTPPR